VIASRRLKASSIFTQYRLQHLSLFSTGKQAGKLRYQLLRYLHLLVKCLGKEANHVVRPRALHLLALATCCKASSPLLEALDQLVDLLQRLLLLVLSAHIRQRTPIHLLQPPHHLNLAGFAQCAHKQRLVFCTCRLCTTL
jgi:hypothetical protein